MTDPASLDRLHDIALPPEVPWWPLAPGWYAVIALVLAAAVWLSCRAWKRWRSDAYRRAALQELKSLQTAAAIAELLRRTALAIAPRPVIAELTGSAWLDWLARQCDEPLPENVRDQLTAGVYGNATSENDLSKLREYATRWITCHNLQSSIPNLQ
jgi:hypothetical protein